MPVKIGTLLKSLSAKAKLDLTDAKYADLLSANLEIPDDVATAIENGLFDFDTAKNNAELDKHFRAKALNGVDAKIKELAEDGDLSSEDAAEILAEKNSYAKIPLLKAKLKATIEAKSAGSGDAKKLKGEYDKLNADMLALKQAQAAELEKLKAQSEEAILNYAIDSHLGSLQYANSDLPADINVLTARNVLQKALADKKAKVVRGADGKLQLKNGEVPDLDYLENNKAISFSDFSASTLASNKLLKVSDSVPPQKQPRNNQPPANVQKVDTSSVSSALRADAAKLAANN